MQRMSIFALTSLLGSLTVASSAHAGTPYIGRHGLSGSAYQEEYDKQAKAGYRLVHVDGYTSGGEARYAAIWEKSSGQPRIARHGMTGAKYQEEFNKHTGNGYRLVLVDGYSINGTAHYAAIWEKGASAPRSARHGLSSQEYQEAFDQHAKDGYRLVYVSGYGVGSQAHYAAIWEKSSGPSRIARHGMTSAKYQSEFEAHTQAGYRLVHVSAYDVDGTDYYAAIWEKSEGPAWLARHRLSSQGYQSEFTQRYLEGFKLVSVSGNTVGSSSRYAAIWQAQSDADTGAYCANGHCFDLERLAQKVEEKTKPYATNKVVKFGFEATRGISKVHRAYGPKRTSKTPPAGDFTVHDRFNPASVSKAVTAVALLQLLDKRHIDIDSKISGHLPPAWSLPASSKTITFAQVLNHSSGLRNAKALVDGKSGYRYEHVKSVLEAGVDLADKSACTNGSSMTDGNGCYQNINYALARELVASLDGFDQWSGNPGPASAARFIDYVNRKVFEPIGVFDVRYKSEGSDDTLFFPYPTGNSTGTDYGDWSLQPGSAGGHNSIHELAFFTRAVFAEKLLSSTKLDELKGEGLGMGHYATLPDGSNCWGKGGYFPGSMNGGAQLESVIIGCDNGVSIAMVINGEKGPKSIVIDALKESFVPAASPKKVVNIHSIATKAKVLVRAKAVKRAIDEKND